MKKFVKNNWFKLLISICLICLTLIVTFSFISETDNKKVNKTKPWKPIEDLYQQDQLINYGVASFIISDSGVKKIEYTKVIGYEEKSCEKPTSGIDFCKFLRGDMPIWGKDYYNLYVIKVTIKNDYDNLNSIFISEDQFIIKDGDNTYYPVNNGVYSPALKGHSLNSGEEFTGYISFENLVFTNPILEINPFKGSFPIKVKINK